MQDIFIFGCGGFGREVLQILLDQNAVAPRWNILGFLVSPGTEAPTEVQGLKVTDRLEALGPPAELAAAVGIGNPAARRRVVQSLQASGLTHFPPLVHPTAWCGRHIVMEEGVVICAGTLLTTDMRLGAHVHVNIGATIGHDCQIGSFCTLSPGAHVSGRVTLGEGVEIGTGACLNPGVTLGAGAVIGSGAAVVRDIPAFATAVGVPARVIRVGGGDEGAP